MAKIIPIDRLRPFYFRHRQKTEFFNASSDLCEKWARLDLAKSGLTPEDIGADISGLIEIPKHAQCGYGIPYFGFDGQAIVEPKDQSGKYGPVAMYRARLKLPEFSKERKYDQPPGSALAKLNLPNNIPYFGRPTFELPHDSGVIYCCEGEKKTASVMKHIGRPAFGIGGKDNWSDGRKGVHPWIIKLLEMFEIRKVVIIPDADVFRYDICGAYGSYAHQLAAIGYEVEILNPPDKIDDLIGEWVKEGKDVVANFDAIKTTQKEELVQNSHTLAVMYNLAFKESEKGIKTLYQHTSNVTRLIENYHAFPRIWRNLDNNRVMVGDKIAQPDLTEMEIANYFQHNLGFDKVTHRIVYSVIQAQAKKNAKSPMLDFIRSQTWDGVERLETWMHRLWGVENTAYTREVSRKWLTSACARMDRAGVKVDWMMIVISEKQGLGKTSMPGIMFKGNSLTMYGQSDDKDLHMKIHSALCIGFDELDSFGKREASFLKAMITTSQDHFRPPYGASVEIFDRRSVLYGCGNRTEFLMSDPSGYRRYAVVSVDRLLDFAALESEVPQLWAEAWVRYTQGDEFWEIKTADEEARNYVIPSTYEEKVLMYLENRIRLAGKNSPEGLVFRTTDIVEFLMVQENPSAVREIAAVLRGIGCKSVVRRVAGKVTKMWEYAPPAESPPP